MRRSAVLAGLAIAAVLAALWWFSDRTDRDLRQMAHAGGEGEVTVGATWRHAVSHEEVQARLDHLNIAEAVAACSGIDDLQGQPHWVREALRVPAPERTKGPRRLAATLARVRASDAPEQDGPARILLSNYARAAIYLSDAIRRLRIEQAYAAASSAWRMNIAQWFIVVLGAATTILISVKAIIANEEELKKLSRGLGFAAIMVSALGTAASALNSFYSPHEAHLKAEQSLATLRRLQSDMAIQLASSAQKGCPSFDPDKPDDRFAKQIQDWKNKLDLIMSAADSESAPPSGTDSLASDPDNAEP